MKFSRHLQALILIKIFENKPITFIRCPQHKKSNRPPHKELHALLFSNIKFSDFITKAALSPQSFKDPGLAGDLNPQTTMGSL